MTDRNKPEEARSPEEWSMVDEYRFIIDKANPKLIPFFRENSLSVANLAQYERGVRLSAFGTPEEMIALLKKDLTSIIDKFICTPRYHSRAKELEEIASLLSSSQSAKEFHEIVLKIKSTTA